MKLRADVALNHLLERVKLVAEELDKLNSRRRRPGGRDDLEIVSIRKSLLDACRRAEKER